MNAIEKREMSGMILSMICLIRIKFLSLTKEVLPDTFNNGILQK